MTTVLRRAGFTLLEVLVGIAVLALAAVVLGAAYVNTLHAHHAVAHRAASGHGVEYLREAVLNEPERGQVEQGGWLNLPGHRQLRWEARVEEAAAPDLFKVTLRGRITGSGDDETFEHTLMLLRPTWSDSAKRERLREIWQRRREAAGR